MKDLYEALGLGPDADAEEISRAAAAHPEEMAAGRILQNPLRKAEYDKAFRALHEIGALRAGLELSSARWEQEQKAFVKSSRAGDQIRKCRQIQQGHILFRTLASVLICACVVILVVRLHSHAGGKAVSLSREAVSERWKASALSGIASFDGKYYKVFNSRDCGNVTSWESASLFCRQQCGQLAVFDSARENLFIYNWLQSQNARDVYFGLTDKDREGVWRTSLNRRPGYLHWASGEPNNEFGNEHYAMFYHRSPPGFWNDGNPGKDFLFLCQWDDQQDFRTYEERLGSKAVNIYIGSKPKAHDMETGSRAAHGRSSPSIVGSYIGEYRTRQGIVGLTLHIRKDEGRYSALFEFYPAATSERGRVKSGKYSMDVQYNALSKNIIMKGTMWIVRPANYEFVHLKGHVSGEKISGTVFTDSEAPSWTFFVRKVE